MLDSFKVKNFRLFRDLEIPRLGRVNLIVGKNNSGKSALLEALELYASNASVYSLIGQIYTRQEYWKERSRHEMDGSAEIPSNLDSALRHLFLGHEFPKFEQPGIMIGSSENAHDRIFLHVAPYSIFTDNEGSERRKLLSQEEASNPDTILDYFLVREEGNSRQRIMLLNQVYGFSKVPSHSIAKNKFPFQTVPTGNISPQKIASLWDSIGFTNLAIEVIAGLKLILPSAKGIGFVENPSSARDPRIPIVSLEGEVEPMPLKSMGDGMTRIFHIILALVSAKDGILLIDEFENGLHWSVQPKVWKTVFRLARKLNVQVFATTHSRDCISSFEEAWKENIEDGGFHRLQLDKNGEVEAKSYNLETLSDSLETEVEVR